MNERNLDELRRRVRRTESDGTTYDVQYLLDKMELVLEEAPMDTPDGLARSLAEQLVEEPDEWDAWITHAEDDYLSWKTVQALVEVLWDRDREALRRGPLFYWMVKVTLSVEPTSQAPQGRDRRFKQFRSMVVAVTVDRLRNLPGGPVIWSELKDSACRLVADRLTGMGSTWALQPDSVYKIWKSYRSRIETAGLLGTPPSWVGKETAD